MIVVIQEDHVYQLAQLPRGAVELLILVLEDFRLSNIRRLGGLAKLVLTEGGAVIIAPSLQDAFLAL